MANHRKIKSAAGPERLPEVGLHERDAAWALPWPRAAKYMSDEALEKFLTDRRNRIFNARLDPLRHGWEPDVWELCDCLLGMPWVDKEHGEAVRQMLGFRRVVDTLLILGGNRGGKTQYAAKRMIKMLSCINDGRAWAFHESSANSIQMQQSVVFEHLPRELRMGRIAEAVAYISFRRQTGFSDGKFVLPNSSQGVFRNYEQNIEKAEGGELDFCWTDELAGPDLLNTLGMRTATREGKLLSTFTPVAGYSATVKMFLDGARVCMKSPGYLLPVDGKEPDIGRAAGLHQELLGLNALEYAEKLGPASIPENLMERVLAGDLQEDKKIHTTEDGRRFEMVPRVMRCMDGSHGKTLDASRAVVFFHSSDNPYGNPLSVARKALARSAEYTRERFYGIANKLQTARFPLFDRGVHCCKKTDIPKRGTRYLLVDPASARNFFMLGVVVTPEEMYVEYEWPGTSEIPWVGFPGPWALPDGKKMDGKVGPAQNLFGFGLHQYKAIIGYLEGWDNMKQVFGDDLTRVDPSSLREQMEALSEDGPAARKTFMRFMDCRFVAVNGLADDGVETLLDEFRRNGLTFYSAHATQETRYIDDGVSLINSALAYDTRAPVSFLNKPKLKVCEDCENLIFSLENWTGKDGQKGACKDPVDCLRMAFLKDIAYVDEEFTGGRAGGGVY